MGLLSPFYKLHPPHPASASRQYRLPQSLAFRGPEGSLDVKDYDDYESSDSYTNFYDYLHIILPSKAITAFPDLLQSAPTAMPYSWMTVFNAI